MSEATIAALEARIRELEDVREITDVFFKWHYACTGGFNGKQAGRMEAGPKGREQYTEFWDYFYGDDGPLPYVFQTSVADKVVVTGDTAVQKSNMLGIFQNRGGKPTIGLSQRTNTYVRTPKGWLIKKTTVDGGFSIAVDELHGNLNKLPEVMSPRTPWTFKG